MASNITNSGTFTVANIKPAPDEEVDALWGQNLGDNTGYLFTRPIRQVYERVFQRIANQTVSGIEAVTATTILDEPFYRPWGHNKFIGTASATTFHDGFNGAETYDVYGTLTLGIYGNLGTWLSDVKYGVLNQTDYVRGDLFATTVDLAVIVSEGSFAQLRYTVAGTTTDPDDAGGHMEYTLRNLKILTTWA